jgi:hypothetical protein
MAKTNALQRSKAHLESLGWQVAAVEKWIPPRGKMKFGVRKDVWGFGDLLACLRESRWIDESVSLERSSGDLIYTQTGQIALIQCCADSGGKAGIEAHKAKIMEFCSNELMIWKLAGGKVYIHGWKRRKPRGERAKWVLTVVEL